MIDGEFDDEEMKLALAMSVNEAIAPTATATAAAGSTASGTAPPAAATAAPALASASDGKSSDFKFDAAAASRPLSDDAYRAAFVALLTELGLQSADAESFTKTIWNRAASKRGAAVATAIAGTAASGTAASTASVAPLALPSIQTIVKELFIAAGAHACRYADIVNHTLRTGVASASPTAATAPSTAAASGAPARSILRRDECMADCSVWYCMCTGGAFENASENGACELCHAVRPDMPAIQTEREHCGAAHRKLMAMRDQIADGVNTTIHTLMKTEQSRLDGLTPEARNQSVYWEWEVIRGGGAQTFLKPDFAATKIAAANVPLYRSIITQYRNESAAAPSQSGVFVLHSLGWSPVTLSSSGGSHGLGNIYQLVRPYVMSDQLRLQNLKVQVLEALAFQLNGRCEEIGFVTRSVSASSHAAPSARDEKSANPNPGAAGAGPATAAAGASTLAGAAAMSSAKGQSLLIDLSTMLRSMGVGEDRIARMTRPIPPPTAAQLAAVNGKFAEYEGLIIVDRHCEILRESGMPESELKLLRATVLRSTGSRSPSAAIAEAEAGDAFRDTASAARDQKSAVSPSGPAAAGTASSGAAAAGVMSAGSFVPQSALSSVPGTPSGSFDTRLREQNAAFERSLGKPFGLWQSAKQKLAEFHDNRGTANAYRDSGKQAGAGTIDVDMSVTSVVATTPLIDGHVGMIVGSVIPFPAEPDFSLLGTALAFSNRHIELWGESFYDDDRWRAAKPATLIPISAALSRPVPAASLGLAASGDEKSPSSGAASTRRMYELRVATPASTPPAPIAGSDAKDTKSGIAAAPSDSGSGETFDALDERFVAVALNKVKTEPFDEVVAKALDTESGVSGVDFDFKFRSYEQQLSRRGKGAAPASVLVAEDEREAEDGCDLKSCDWNEWFQSALDRVSLNQYSVHEQRRAVDRIMRLFEFVCRQIVDVIVDEWALPATAKRVIPPLVAAKRQYRWGNILFSVVDDSDRTFGGIANAQKAATSEISAYNTVIAAIGSTDTTPATLIRVPLISAFRCANGHVIIATAIVSSIDDSTLVYGSTASGRTVDDREAGLVREPVAALIAELRIRPAPAVTTAGAPASLSLPFDCELHLARDGRYYLFHLARLFPAQPPALASTDAVYSVRRYRPEFIKSQCKALLPCDAFVKLDANPTLTTASTNDAQKLLHDTLLPRLSRHLVDLTVELMNSNSRAPHAFAITASPTPASAPAAAGAAPASLADELFDKETAALLALSAAEAGIAPPAAASASSVGDSKTDEKAAPAPASKPTAVAGAAPIPAAAAGADSLRELAIWADTKLSDTFHRRGINMRYLGVVRSLIKPPPPPASAALSEAHAITRSVLLMEMVSRVIKHRFRRAQRALVASKAQISSLIAQRSRLALARAFLVAVVGSDADSEAFWRTICADLNVKYAAPAEEVTADELSVVRRYLSNPHEPYYLPLFPYLVASVLRVKCMVSLVTLHADLLAQSKPDTKPLSADGRTQAVDDLMLSLPAQIRTPDVVRFTLPAAGTALTLQDATRTQLNWSRELERRQRLVNTNPNGSSSLAPHPSFVVPLRALLEVYVQAALDQPTASTWADGGSGELLRTRQLARQSAIRTIQSLLELPAISVTDWIRSISLIGLSLYQFGAIELAAAVYESSMYHINGYIASGGVLTKAPGAGASPTAAAAATAAAPAVPIFTLVNGSGPIILGEFDATAARAGRMRLVSDYSVIMHRSRRIKIVAESSLEVASFGSRISKFHPHRLLHDRRHCIFNSSSVHSLSFTATGYQHLMKKFLSKHALHPIALDARVCLADVKCQTSEYSDALGLVTSALREQEKRLHSPATHPALVWTLYVQATAQAGMKEFSAAIRSLERAIEQSTTVYGDTHFVTCRLWINMSRLRRHAAGHALAQNNKSEAVAQWRTVGGSIYDRLTRDVFEPYRVNVYQHPATVDITLPTARGEPGDLSIAAGVEAILIDLARGDLRRAIVLAEKLEAHAVQSPTLGTATVNRHLVVAVVRLVRGQVLSRSGYYNAAQDRTALTLAESASHALGTRMNVSTMLAQELHLPAGMSNQADMVDFFHHFAGSDLLADRPSERAIALTDLAACYVTERFMDPVTNSDATPAMKAKNATKLADAEAQIKRAIEVRKSVFGSESVEVWSTAYSHALILSRRGRFVPALRLAERAVAGVERKLNVAVEAASRGSAAVGGVRVHPTVAFMHVGIAHLLHVTGQYAAAERRALTAIDALRLALGATHAHTSIALLTLARLKLDTGHYHAATAAIVFAMEGATLYWTRLSTKTDNETEASDVLLPYMNASILAYLRRGMTEAANIASADRYLQNTIPLVLSCSQLESVIENAIARSERSRLNGLKRWSAKFMTEYDEAAAIAEVMAFEAQSKAAASAATAAGGTAAASPIADAGATALFTCADWNESLKSLSFVNAQLRGSEIERDNASILVRYHLEAGTVACWTAKWANALSHTKEAEAVLSKVMADPEFTASVSAAAAKPAAVTPTPTPIASASATSNTTTGAAAVASSRPVEDWKTISLMAPITNEEDDRRRAEAKQKADAEAKAQAAAALKPVTTSAAGGAALAALPVHPLFAKIAEMAEAAQRALDRKNDPLSQRSILSVAFSSLSLAVAQSGAASLPKELAPFNSKSGNELTAGAAAQRDQSAAKRTNTGSGVRAGAAGAGTAAAGTYDRDSKSGGGTAASGTAAAASSTPMYHASVPDGQMKPRFGGRDGASVIAAAEAKLAERDRAANGHTAAATDDGLMRSIAVAVCGTCQLAYFPFCLKHNSLLSRPKQIPAKPDADSKGEAASAAATPAAVAVACCPVSTPSIPKCENLNTSAISCGGCKAALLAAAPPTALASASTSADTKSSGKPASAVTEAEIAATLRMANTPTPTIQYWSMEPQMAHSLPRKLQLLPTDSGGSTGEQILPTRVLRCTRCEAVQFVAGKKSGALLLDLDGALFCSVESEFFQPTDFTLKHAIDKCGGAVTTVPIRLDRDNAHNLSRFMYV